MISVLCPSRGRPDLLDKSLRSLLDTAADPSSVELLVGFDDDDEATNQATMKLLRPGIDQVWVTPRLGYRRLHDYYNALSAIASGDWLLIWNDDAVMHTVGWDAAIAAHPDHVCETIEGMCFPAIPAAWVRHLGHVALEWHNDAWWEMIAKLLDRRVALDLDGSHDIPWDRTSAEARKRNPDFYGEENMALIRADVEKIKEIL